MSNTQFITVQVGNTSFQVPIQGSNPSWAEDLTAIIVALAEVSQLTVGPNDILTSSATILNNQTETNFGNVTFDTAEVLSFEMDFFITRQFDDGGGPETLTQSGKILANYNGSDWKLSQDDVGDSNVIFNITAGGVLQYTSQDLTGHIESTCRFRVKTIDEEV